MKKRLTNVRWRQFSLKSILLLTLVTAVFFAEFGRRRSLYFRREARVASRADEMGGSVHWKVLADAWSYPLAEKFGLSLYYRVISHVNLTGCRVTSEDIALLGKLQQPFKIVLDRTSVTDESLLQLGQLRSVVVLSLASTRITDEGLVHLRQMPSLEQLYVERTSVTNEALQKLGEALPRLDAQGATATRVSAEILGHRDFSIHEMPALRLQSSSTAGTWLAEMSQVESLSLDRVKKLPKFLECAHRLSQLTDVEVTPRDGECLSADTLAALGNVAGLQQLTLRRHSTIDPIVLRAWSKTKLRSLSLPDTVEIKAQHVEAFCELQYLEVLDLRGADVFNDGVQRLLKLPRLRQLSIRNPDKSNWTRHWSTHPAHITMRTGEQYQSEQVHQADRNPLYCLDVPMADGHDMNARWQSGGGPGWFRW